MNLRSQHGFKISVEHIKCGEARESEEKCVNGGSNQPSESQKREEEKRGEGGGDVITLHTLISQ